MTLDYFSSSDFDWFLPDTNIRRRVKKAVRDIEHEQGKGWKDPTPEMLNDPTFNAIWNVIKDWDVNVPSEYDGYCGPSGNHVRAILDAVNKVKK